MGKSLKLLDPKLPSDETIEFERALRGLVVGQDRAVRSLVKVMEHVRAGFNEPNHTLANLLFLGPSGSGKTHLVESLAQVLYGSTKALLKVDCGEFTHSHEMAKLIGCFTPDTLVLLEDGSPRPIAEIEVGDKVITRQGRAREVQFIHKFDHDGELVELHVANNNVPLRCTPQHLILAIKLGHNGARPTTKAARNPNSWYDSGKLEWTSASELQKGDIVAYPRVKTSAEPLVSIDLADFAPGAEHDKSHVWYDPEKKVPRYLPVNTDFMRLAGYYVAEGGSSVRRMDLTFGLQPHKRAAVREAADLLGRLFGLDYSRKILERDSSNRLYFSCKVAAALMTALFGSSVLRKKIPAFFYDLPDELLWEFLDTAIAGDGGRTVRRRVDYSTSSPVLASQLRMLIHRLGFTTQIQRHESTRIGWAPRYRIYIAGDQISSFAAKLPSTGSDIDLENTGHSGIQRMSHVDESYIYFKIKKIKTVEYRGPVYDLSVAEDTCYVSNGIIVKNSPPGYLGHRETQPIITQEALEQHYTDKHKISILLFDEIEKAHYEFTNVLLGMLDRAGLTLGDNRRVSFASTIVFMTSNAGVRDITKALSGGIGYRATATAEEDERTDKKVYDAAKAALSRQFTAEFLNRIDKTIVFRALSDEEMGRVLDVELARVQETIMVSSTSRQFVFTCTPAARKFLLKEGFDPKYGARHLRRAIRRLLSNPLASLVGSGQIQFGDLVAVDYKQNSGELQFSLTPAAALVTKGAE